MNKLISAALCIALFSACHDTKSINTPNTDSVAIPPPPPPAEPAEPKKEIVTVTGKVAEIQNGKDGYTAKITTADGVVYFVTASIPNSTDPKNYRRVVIGDSTTVKGEFWKQEEEKHILVREFLK